MNQSLATDRELHQKIIFYNPVRQIMTDEPEIKVCRGCGELEDFCLCEPETKLRFKISEIIAERGFQWMTNEVLRCDVEKVRPYLDIAVFFHPSEELYKLSKKVSIESMQWVCDECGKFCIPNYFTGINTEHKPICKHCADILYGH